MPTGRLVVTVYKSLHHSFRVFWPCCSHTTRALTVFDIPSLVTAAYWRTSSFSFHDQAVDIRAMTALKFSPVISLASCKPTRASTMFKNCGTASFEAEQMVTQEHR